MIAVCIILHRPICMPYHHVMASHCYKLSNIHDFSPSSFEHLSGCIRIVRLFALYILLLILSLSYLFVQRDT
jgi:hypothetical protein